MKFGVPWSVKGIRPEARETAKEAARRAGVPLSEWLNAAILREAEEQGIDPYAHSEDESHYAEVHQRLDDLARRIERMSRGGPAAYAPPHIRSESDKVAEMISRLDRRLDQFAHASRPWAPAPPPPLAPAPVPPVPMPPSLDRAIAEIAARQRALNGASAQTPGPTPEAAATPAAPRQTAPPAPMQAPLPAQDLSGLEDQLRRITDQIETLRKPGVEEAINALRSELIEIANALNDAMPRREIETIEKQIAGLAQRIAEGRQAGAEQGALAGIEHGLAEVRDALRSLTPAESLIGFNDAVAGLAQKIDSIVAQKDPAAMQQLESAVTTLRSIAAHVASNETVSHLAAEVQALSDKVDHMAHTASGGAALDHLEQRIGALADALAERAQSGATVPPQLETLVQSLSDKIEQIQNSRSDDVAMGHLEDRIVKLVEKLDASESRLGQLEAIERGLSDLLVHIETGKQAQGLRADASPVVDELKHDMARTKDALDDVHGTLALVVDRLAAIEHGMRAEAQPSSGGKLAVRAVSTAREAPQHLPPATPLQMPPPAVAQKPPAPPHQPPEAAAPLPRRRAAATVPINPDLPPDQPLEPGSGPPPLRANPAARIAASEAALGDIAPAAAAPTGASSFIAAARRAAQAALQSAPGVRGRPQDAMEAPPLQPEAEPIEDEPSDSLAGRLKKRVKSLFIAIGIIALVGGGVQFAGQVLDFGARKTAKIGKVASERDTRLGEAPRVETGPANEQVKTAPPLAAPKTAEAVTPGPAFNFDRSASKTFSMFDPPDLAPAAKLATDDITGSIPQRAKETQPPPADHLPLAIGGAKLRSAAAAGDAGAAYEVAVRFAEGRGVPTNSAEAARWFARAAAEGLAPAQFRYGSMLEKGQGVKKDLEAARRLYLAAAGKGNAKAMHNLAVLYAEGIDGKPDYATAVQWFRRAALHGISDSQYNLGVLCARGLGTDKSFAESYKWFALAATNGDPESAKKRDEIATHLDAAALAAAEREVKTFKAAPQPEAAIVVPKPPGGWDGAAAKSEAAGAPAKPKARTHAPLSLGAFTLGTR